ncbi:spermidine synthase [Undibacterium fentianense]|uniref:Spermidine synthase n=1 Tax=Undibacterium fentianense TaxID=2828728 RepID=A0A941ICI8_9BURK|nr:spermidine synthase [Undibacterium fentianense]MBR7800239.1 spermidine synthase [Undibacterium fentianense]
MKKKNVNSLESSAYPQVFVSEFRGVRSLHLAGDHLSDVSCAPIQGSMRLAVPDQIELEYVQQMNVWMLFNTSPRHIVQLGLGAASLTKFCYRQFPDARVTAVELNPFVIEICRSQFKLPDDDDRLTVLEMDAFDFVRDQRRHASVDVLQVDLYDAVAEGPVLDSPEFYRACSECLVDDGMLTVNLFANQLQRERNIAAMYDYFDVVVWLPEVHDANVVAIAFKKAPEIDFAELYRRAAILRVNHKIQAPVWVNGLKEWMLREE